MAARRGVSKVTRRKATKARGTSARAKQAARGKAAKPAARTRTAAAKPARKAKVAKRKPGEKPAKRPRAAKPAARAHSQAAASRGAMVRELERGCDAVLAAIRGLKPEAANRPIAPGKRTPREIVLHMAFWDEWMLGVLPAAITRNRRAPELTPERVEAMNAGAVASGAALEWNEVRELWATQRALLLALLAAVPAAPAERWGEGHALGSLLHGYAAHDLHHAAQIRAARSAKRPAFTPAFAAQREAASPKELLLFELQRARVSVTAALQGLLAGPALRPTAPGKWSLHEIVLHLAARDRARLEEFAAVHAGARASWMGLEPAATAAMNEAHLAPLRSLSWDEALRLLHSTREQLLAALVAAPDEPGERWTEAHPFGAMLHALHRHDRHHAAQIKQARISR